VVLKKYIMEKSFKPFNGFAALLFLFVSLGLLAFGIVIKQPLIIIPMILVCINCMIGFMVINPNESAVLTLFGAYKGTAKENGFYWVNPFLKRRKVSLRARNMDSEPIKVNDKLGNPILIGVVLVWRVKNTFKAIFEVDAYEHFVKVQSESAIRKLAGTFSYDDFEDHDAEITLRSGGEEVDHILEKELQYRLEIAGIEVVEARISNLAYASEIAGAMLQRQQATAIVAARHKIVEGAVGMVDMALEMLSKKNIVELDEDKKAAMVSNLMVVLCSDRAAQPVINSGTLHN
jgi:regulator of protease activity HflC (stomatin/prohibitin superfamily)